jgi:SAM-dependent methyltransferase
MPAYLKSNGLQNPENPQDGPFQYGHNHTGHAFAWLVDHPEVFQAFHNYVYTLRKHRPSWTDMYPVQRRLVEGRKEGDASALVDIGGGTGQLLQEFRRDFPQYSGKLILQELPEVIAAAQDLGVGEDQQIDLQVHDFFKPQPVRGARAYFMRSVLHDWADEQCRTILGHLKDAMEPGYSRILINDCVRRRCTPSLFPSSLA